MPLAFHHTPQTPTQMRIFTTAEIAPNLNTSGSSKYPAATTPDSREHSSSQCLTVSSVQLAHLDTPPANPSTQL